MKKVLSLALAVMLVLGMSTMAFAAPVNDKWTQSVNIGDIAQGASSVTFTLPVTDDILAAAATTPGDFSYIRATITSNTLQSEIREFLDADNADVALVGGASNPKLEVTLYPQKDSNTGNWLATGSYTIGLKLTASATNGGTATNTLTYTSVKFKVTGTTSTTSVIPSGWKIVGVMDGWEDMGSWSTGDFNPYTNDTVTEDMTAKFPLKAEMFAWEDKDGNTVYPPSDAVLRSNHLTAANVKAVKTNPVNNSGTIKEIVVDGTTLKVKTVTYFLKCGSTDVAFDLGLSVKGKTSGTKYGARFTIKNEEELMSDGQDYVETTDPIYVKADVSLRNVEMFIGENLYLTKSFGSGQKAYAHVSLELSAGDEALFHKYSELSDVYTLYTVGVNSANVYAEFKDLGDTYFVYDENFKLLGTTADKKLPFSSKYYLTTKKVDLAGTDAAELPADEDSSTAPTGDTGNAGTGGGTVSAPTNYNPNTGC